MTLSKRTSNRERVAVAVAVAISADSVDLVVLEVVLKAISFLDSAVLVTSREGNREASAADKAEEAADSAADKMVSNFKW